MARRNEGIVDTLAALPWPVGVIFGTSGFAIVRFGLPAYLQSSPFTAALEPLTVWMSWFFLGAGLFGAALSWATQFRRRRLLDTQQGLDGIAALGWRHFEQLVGEAFRRQGYTVEETGVGGADGGIDLVLRKDGRRVLVQCKQWRRRQVPVNVVREMFGLLAHHGADQVKIACSGSYTRDAERFAQGKPIELIGGEALLRMIRSVQGSPEPRAGDGASSERAAPGQIPVHAPPGAQPSCPNCSKEMVRRRNRTTGQTFWGCTGFPTCRGVR